MAGGDYGTQGVKCSKTDGGEGYTSANVLQTTERCPLHGWIAQYASYISIKQFKKDCENAVSYLPDGTYALYISKDSEYVQATPRHLMTPISQSEN